MLRGQHMPGGFCSKEDDQAEAGQRRARTLHRPIHRGTTAREGLGSNVRTQEPTAHARMLQGGHIVDLQQETNPKRDWCKSAKRASQVDKNQGGSPEYACHHSCQEKTLQQFWLRRPHAEVTKLSPK